MNNIISDKKLEKYIKDHDFSIKHDTVQHIVNNLKKKSSKLFSKLNQKGGTTMAGEYFGVNTGAYSETLSSAPTEVSTSNALETSTRPALVSEEFPLQGGCGCTSCGMTGGGHRGDRSRCYQGCGCGRVCGTCNKQAGGCVTCGVPSGGGSECQKHNELNCSNCQKGGCMVCKNFFSQQNIKDISKLLNLKLKKNQYNEFNHNLSNDLKKLMHSTFSQVKNKDNLIGKSHFMKALKGF